MTRADPRDRARRHRLRGRRAAAPARGASAPRPRGVASDSQPDEPVAQFFRHLQPVLPHLRFASHDEIIEYVTANPATAVFSAAPHGVSAGTDRPAAARPPSRPARSPRVVDISADFRLHERRGLRGRLQARARRAGPPRGVHLRGARAPERAAHAARRAPRLLRDGDPARRACRCCRSASSSRGCSCPASPAAPAPAGNRWPARTTRSGTATCTPTTRWRIGTRRRSRRSRMAASGVEADFCFVPHSGPFARGIHVTVQAEAEGIDRHARARAARCASTTTSRCSCASSGELPRIKDVVASNFAELSGVAHGQHASP